jgi:D-amino-acid dehydrogenase
MAKQIGVIGAGIVGVSIALALQMRGFSVTLIDRRDPGSETSYGNAGVITRYSVFPLNGPEFWNALPRLLRNKHPSLRYRSRHVAANLHWFVRFLAGATAAKSIPRTAALDALISNSCALHRRWIADAGVAHRLRDNGTLRLWRNERSRRQAEVIRAGLEAFGLEVPVLKRDDISTLEPSIAPIFAVGLFNKDNASVDSPGDVTRAYAALFRSRGGFIHREECLGLSQQGDGAWRVYVSSGSSRRFDGIVVALGPWSADLLKPVGYNVPLGFERGYHQEFSLPNGHTLSRPLYDADNSYFMTPMENRIRITTGIEMAARDAPSNYSQCDAAISHAREILPLGRPVSEPWRGARPTLPDCLPVIGAAPRHENLWIAFGNSHIGFTTGPATGEIVARIIAGELPLLDMTAFRPERYL